MSSWLTYLLINSATAANHTRLVVAVGNLLWSPVLQCNDPCTLGTTQTIVRARLRDNWTQYTHRHLFNSPFPRQPGWAGTRKVKPIWILLKQETVSGSGISWAKSAPRSRQTTMPAPHHSVFSRPDALPVAQPAVSKHWRQISTAQLDAMESLTAAHPASPLPPVNSCKSVSKVCAFSGFNRAQNCHAGAESCVWRRKLNFNIFMHKIWHFHFQI